MVSRKMKSLATNLRRNKTSEHMLLCLATDMTTTYVTWLRNPIAEVGHHGWAPLQTGKQNASVIRCENGNTARVGQRVRGVGPKKKVEERCRGKEQPSLCVTVAPY
ncbi:hypothetical protein ACJJTC_010424 [Scirpophaga incertulas]